MSPIQFNPEDPEFSSLSRGEIPPPLPKSSKMASWVLKTGMVKTEEQANYVLLGIAGVFFIVSLYLFFGEDLSGSNAEIQYREDIPPMILEQLPPDILQQIPSRGQ